MTIAQSDAAIIKSGQLEVIPPTLLNVNLVGLYENQPRWQPSQGRPQEAVPVPGLTLVGGHTDAPQRSAPTPGEQSLAFMPRMGAGQAAEASRAIVTEDANPLAHLQFGGGFSAARVSYAEGKPTGIDFAPTSGNDLFKAPSNSAGFELFMSSIDTGRGLTAAVETPNNQQQGFFG